MRRKKQKQIPQIPPTDLESTEFIDRLKQDSDEDLVAALGAATQCESWFYGLAESLKDDEVLAGRMTVAAAHARISREVMAIILALRAEKKGGKQDGPSSPGAYL
jgi:hypothetical protein